MILAISLFQIYVLYLHWIQYLQWTEEKKSFIRLFEGSIKNPEIDSTSAVGQEKEKIVCDWLFIESLIFL